VSANHEIEGSYLPGAADIDASPDTSVRAFLSGAGHFFDGTQVTTARYVITRVT
jgi:hypothetical protein